VHCYKTNFNFASLFTYFVTPWQTFLKITAEISTKIVVFYFLMNNSKYYYSFDEELVKLRITCISIRCAREARIVKEPVHGSVIGVSSMQKRTIEHKGVAGTSSQLNQ
jgi:hypothetical protein